MSARIILSIAAAAIALTALTGCASGGSPQSDKAAGTNDPTLYERTIKLTDGRTVTCVIYAEGYKGGVSCDWDNAR